MCLSLFPLFFASPLFRRLKPQGDGSTVHPLTSFWGSHSSLVKPRARQSVSTRAVLTTTGIQGIWVEFRSCSSPVLPLHRCLQITGLASHASHTAALSDGVVAVSARTRRDQIWITTGARGLYTFAPALGLVVPGGPELFFSRSPLFFCLCNLSVRSFSSDDQRRWRPSCLPLLALAESGFPDDMKEPQIRKSPRILET